MTDDCVPPSINPLGLKVGYSSQYDPSLLFAIARKEKRLELGLINSSDFFGEDIWNAYELSWLNLSGVPQVAIGEIRFSASSVNIVESKSLKLYLNSYNQSSFDTIHSVEKRIQQDLSNLVESEVRVFLSIVDDFKKHAVNNLNSECIDDSKVVVTQYDYDPSLLSLEVESDGKATQVKESLCSHLLKSNCLITNQPDWASIIIEYEGQKISHSSLLQYIVSFRMHNEFHEQCVERIYCDLMKFCSPSKLTVYARYTRRGGLDINPWRSNHERSMNNIRLPRQ